MILKKDINVVRKYLNKIVTINKKIQLDVQPCGDVWREARVFGKLVSRGNLNPHINSILQSKDNAESCLKQVFSYDGVDFSMNSIGLNRI